MDILKIAYLENLQRPSIEEEPILVLQVDSEPCWMDILVHYLQEGTLLEDKAKARKLKYRSTLFLVFDGKLYKQA